MDKAHFIKNLSNLEHLDLLLEDVRQKMDEVVEPSSEKKKELSEAEKLLEKAFW